MGSVDNASDFGSVFVSNDYFARVVICFVCLNRQARFVCSVLGVRFYFVLVDVNKCFHFVDLKKEPAPTMAEDWNNNESNFPSARVKRNSPPNDLTHNRNYIDIIFSSDLTVDRFRIRFENWIVVFVNELVIAFFHFCPKVVRNVCPVVTNDCLNAI